MQFFYTLSFFTEELKIENQSLKTKFEKTLESESSLKEAFSVSETRITELTNDLEKQKELVTLMKENEKGKGKT